MTIYGTKAAKLIVVPISNRCDNCNTVHTMDMYIFQKYKAVLGIPFFPVSKTGVSLCAHCRQTLRRKEMSAALLYTYKQVKARTSVPVWTWTGVALVLLAVLMLVLLN